MRRFLSLSSSFGNLYRRSGDVIVVACIRPGAILMSARKDGYEPCSDNNGLRNLPALVLLPLTSHFLLAFRFHITQLMLVVYTEFKLVPLN